MRCDEPHPDTAGVTCAKDAHPFGDHYEPSSGLVWEGMPRPVRAGTKKARSRLVEVADRIGTVPIERTGPPVSPTAVPHLAAVAWRERQPQWLAEAKAALHHVAERHLYFTTGEIWPLIDAPAEKRAMVLVIRHGIRLDWMHEDSARRENGVYKTRDGVEFPLNKLVPIYKSHLFIEKSKEKTP